jgi:type IV pilus assembly protein PilV
MKEDLMFKNAGSRAGFSLIEVLVALLVLSIGLLGLAGLQTRGLQGNQGSLLRSQAVKRGEDILDRMRANPTAARGGSYNIALNGDPDSTGMAQTDLTEWKTAMAGSLPAGDGSVAVAANIATVIVQWDEAGGQRSVTLVTRL